VLIYYLRYITNIPRSYSSGKLQRQTIVVN
ncbi:hypothetical protein MPH_13438, partial [Macrophomina phaseolina MS6]